MDPIAKTAIHLHLVAERKIRYHAALRLVTKIDDDLTRGIRHYRTRTGKLLMTLDEVVRAILANELALTEEAVIEWIEPVAA